MAYLVRLMAAAVFSSCLCVAASDSPIDRESLRDLDGVRVAVDELPASAARLGFTQDRLRKQIEDKLRAAGIRVQNPGEFPVGDPALRLHLAIAPQSNKPESKGLEAYTVELDFAQIVFLRRNPAVTFNRAQTWSAGAEMGLAPRGKIAEAVNRAIGGQVDRFVAAFRSVN